MTGETVYQALLDLVRKDARGSSLSVDEFNRVSNIVNQRVLSDYFATLEEGIESSNDIGAYKVLDYSLAISGGKATLPANYYQLIGEPYYVDSTLGTRYFDVVTSLEHAKRERNSVSKSTAKYPTCLIGSEDSNGDIEIRVYPTTITTIYIDYIRTTATPFLDYYVNTTTLQKTYLAAGVQNVVIASPYVYRDGTTGTKNSASVDWDYSDSDLPLILSYFVQILGLQLPDNALVEIGKIDKSEILG